MKKKIWEMNKEELFELEKKYSVDPKKNKRKIEEILWAIRSIQIQERKDRGEDVSMCYAGYTGRNSNK